MVDLKLGIDKNVLSQKDRSYLSKYETGKKFFMDLDTCKQKIKELEELISSNSELLQSKEFEKYIVSKKFKRLKTGIQGDIDIIHSEDGVDKIFFFALDFTEDNIKL